MVGRISSGGGFVVRKRLNGPLYIFFTFTSFVKIYKFFE